MSHHRAKLTPAQVDSIRASLGRGFYQRQVALAHGVSQSTVSMIARKLTWKPKPMPAWTPEPWTTWDKFPSLLLVAAADDNISCCIPQGADESSVNANAQRILACINGCQGLNPAAYRECVEAIHHAIRQITEEDYSNARKTLLGAEEAAHA